MLPTAQRDGHFILIDGQGVAGSLSEAEAKAVAARLDRLDGQSLGANGDKFVVDNEQNYMIKLAGDDTKAQLTYVIAGDWKYMPPDTVKSFFHSTISAVATLWKQLG